MSVKKRLSKINIDKKNNQYYKTYLFDFCSYRRLIFNYYFEIGTDANFK